MLTIVIRAFFPGRDFDYGTLKEIRDPGWRMLLPLTLFVIAMAGFGLFSGPVVEALEAIAAPMP